MKKYVFFPILILSILLFSLPLFAATSFSDIEGHWAENDILYVAQEGLVHGCPDGTFLPQKAITRGEMVTILAYASRRDFTANDGMTKFSDCNTHWASKAIKWASSSQVVAGYDDNTFRPNQSITREELAQMLYRYHRIVAGMTLPQSVAPVTFDDTASIGSWAREAVSALQQSGVIAGVTSKTFAPKNNASRAEASSMLARYWRLIQGVGDVEQGNTNLYVNNVLVRQIDVVNEGNTAYVPVRAFFEALHYRVLYYGTSDLVVVCNHEKDMEMWVGKTSALAKTAVVTMSAPPKIMKGSIYVPLSNLATPLGLKISTKATAGIYVSHTPTAVSLSAHSFYGTGSLGAGVNGQANLGDSQGFLGTVANGQMQYGSYTLQAGTAYMGNWAGGTMRGNGTMVNAAGDVSIGIFSNGVLSNGTTFYSDGSTFSGQWYHNTSGAVYPSVGVYTDAQGNTYGTSGSSWSGGSIRIY